MKKLYPFLFVGLTIFSQAVNATEIYFGDLGPQEINAPAEEASAGAFSFDISGDYIRKADFRKTYGFHHLALATGQAQLGYTYYYDECYQEGANVAVMFERTDLHWKTNPYFGQRSINTVTLALDAFTSRLENWIWRGQLSANFDNVDKGDFNDYMNYDILLWGRYAYCQGVGFHFGIVSQVGMHINRYYPVIGFDWQCSDSWKLNLVFPMNLSITYTLDRTWSFALAGRFFDQCHRVQEDEYLSKGLWLYQAAGAEFAINFTPACWVSANIHAGTTLWSRLKIADRHYHHHRNFELNPSPYAGAEIAFNF